jgi:cyanuric acid amidohydrolase
MLTTSGNGCVNDFSRTLSAHVWEPLIPESSITVFSGGTEGVLSPHITFIVADPNSSGLIASVGRTRELAPHEIGSAEHAQQVAKTMTEMMAKTGVAEEDVNLVLIKCPLLTSAKIEAIKAAGKIPVTTDTYKSMAKSRYASAIGIAIALGELKAEIVWEENLDAINHWSAKASCSSGAELEDNHILLLASSPSPGRLGAVSNYMTDAIDAKAILESLNHIKAQGGEVVQVFVKAESDPQGKIRGKRHTMNTDSDIHSTRHARAAVGGLVAGLTGDTEVYCSGGAEGQGPPGGGSLCIVYERSL